MRIVNNKTPRELFGEYNCFYMQQVMDDNERNDLFRKLSREGRVLRFYKWELIGSYRAVGYFDYFNWYPHDPDRIEVHQGFIEKSLKDIYNQFDTFAAVTYTSNAWTTAGQYTQWTIPTNWNDLDNYMDVIGGGGHGAAYGTSTTCGFAGCGGGYARKNNSALTKGGTLYIHPGAAGSSSWVNNTSNASPTSLSKGPLATGGGSAFQGGDMSLYAGSPGSGTYGDIKHTGGQGPSFLNYGGVPGWSSGGGGAAGPNGNGGAGSDGGYTGYSGGGGGNGGGTAGGNFGGGNNSDGYGGGSATGGAGTYGGGAGGGGNSSGGNGGNGGNGSEYNNGAWGSGGGSSGGYTVGTAGNYGAGAAINCRTAACPNGAGGLVVIAYAPISNFAVMGGGSLLIV